MICTKCGARMLDTDQFCPKCGAKAVKEKRCPGCGTVLRDGTRFCHKCGTPVEGRASVRKVSLETLDIPIDAIEQNILSETAAEIKADQRKSSKGAVSHDSSGKSSSSKGTSVNSPPSKSTQSKKKSSVAAPPPKKRIRYREEEDWDDDDWDDDDEEDGVDAITIMTAIVGCVLLVVVAILGYQMYRQYIPKNYEKAAEEAKEEGQEEPGEEMEGAQVSGSETAYTLTIIHNVNVRDNPSTSGTNVLKVAQEGETYTSYGSVENGEWYEILLEDGSVGYVFHEYVTVE